MIKITAVGKGADTVFTVMRVGCEPFVTCDPEELKEELRRLRMSDPDTLLKQVRRYGAIEFPTG